MNDSNSVNAAGAEEKMMQLSADAGTDTGADADTCANAERGDYPAAAAAGATTAQNNATPAAGPSSILINRRASELSGHGGRRRRSNDGTRRASFHIDVIQRTRTRSTTENSIAREQDASGDGRTCTNDAPNDDNPPKKRRSHTSGSGILNFRRRRSSADRRRSSYSLALSRASDGSRDSGGGGGSGGGGLVIGADNASGMDASIGVLTGLSAVATGGGGGRGSTGGGGGSMNTSAAGGWTGAGISSASTLSMSIGLPSVVSVFGEEKRLALNDVPLRGRQEEMAVLEKCFRRVALFCYGSGSGGEDTTTAATATTPATRTDDKPSLYNADGTCSNDDNVASTTVDPTTRSGSDNMNSRRRSLTSQQPQLSRARRRASSVVKKRSSYSSLVSSVGATTLSFESEVIILSGKSGTGKTALFNEFRRQVVPSILTQMHYKKMIQQQHDQGQGQKQPRLYLNRRQKVLFGSGKFNQPFMATSNSHDANDGVMKGLRGNGNNTDEYSGRRLSYSKRPSLALLNPGSEPTHAHQSSSDHARPYAAIASAFSEICRQLQPHECDMPDRNGQSDSSYIVSEDQWDAEYRAKIVSRVRDAVGGVEGLALLSKIIGPIIWNVFGEPGDADIVQKSSSRRLSSIGGGFRTRKGTAGGVNSGTDTGSSDWNMAQRRFAFVIRSFLGALCGDTDVKDGSTTENIPFAPVVLHFDDVQWADSSSMELIKAFATDAAISGLMIVLAHRECDDGNSERENDDAWNETTRYIEEERGNTPRLEMTGLNVEAIADILSDLLAQDTEKMQPLAEVLHRKTLGNAFYLLSFIREMEMKRMIKYSPSEFCWVVGDLQRIKDGIDMSSNVVDMTASRIKRLPASNQSLLMIASCLSSNFTRDNIVNILFKACAASNSGDGKEDNIFSFIPRESLTEIEKMTTKMLDDAVSDGLLEFVGNAFDGSDERYRWPHDRIQVAAYSLLPDCSMKRGKTHLLLGRILWTIYSKTEDSNEKEWAMFAAVEQFGRCVPLLTDEKERFDLAGLYLDAALAAIDESAFSTASGLLSSGIELLGEKSSWSSTDSEGYNLRLDYERLVAEMDLCHGNVSECIERCNFITANARSFEDKLGPYFTLVNAHSSQGNNEETWKLCCSLLERLGVHLTQPAGWKLRRQVAIELSRTKKALDRYSSEEDFLYLPTMADPLKIASMKLLSRLLNAAWHMGRKHHICLISCKMIGLTLQHGLCSMTAFAFCMYGEVLIHPVGDLIEGFRFGKISVLLLKRLQAREAASQLYFNVFTMINHWREPLSRSLDPLLLSHRIGLESGDIEHAFYSALAYVTLYYYSGLPLGPLKEDIQAFASKMAEHKQKAVFFLTLPLWQCVLNLLGMSTNPLLMQGEAYEAGKLFDNDKNIGEQSAWSYQMQLAVYFGELTLAKELCDKLLKLGGSNEWHYFACARTFFFGLIAVDLYRKYRKRKYKQLAQKMAAKLKKWTTAGAINCLHKYLILKAELASIKGSVDEVKTDGDSSINDIRRIYDAATPSSQRSGFGQDAALANERAGEYLLRLRKEGDLDDPNDYYWPEIYITRAHRLYSEWGALGKANDLSRRRSNLIESQSKYESRHKKGSNMQGRQRFDDMSYLAREKESSAHRKIGFRFSAVSSSMQSFSASVANSTITGR